MLKQHQANQASQAPDNEAELPVELPVKHLPNTPEELATELIPQTSQNPKDKPETETKPKTKPKSVSEGMSEEPKEEKSEMKETYQKAHNRYDGSGQAVECEQHSESISEKQGEEKNKRVRAGPLTPDTADSMSSTDILTTFYTILAQCYSLIHYHN